MARNPEKRRRKAEVQALETPVETPKARRQRKAAEATDAPTAPVITDPMDSRTPPSANGGWSETVQTVQGAFVVPTSGRGLVQVGGVFDADRGFVHQAVHWRRGRALLEPIRPRRVPVDGAETLPGRWLWGGILLNHFGHFLTESTPRLWGLAAVDGPLDGILFLHKRNAEVIPLHNTFLRLMGHDLPIRVVEKVTRVEELHIPGQGFGIGRISAGTNRFREVFRTTFARDIAADGPERLYISRSALGPKRGGVIGEVFIEEHLAKHGYEVFHPQHHSLEVQIARYRAAKDIIALDGSALHLAAFCATPGQRVAMVRRRNSSVSKAIGIHLAAFTGRGADVIDAIQTDWVLKAKGNADRFSMGELNMPQLQQKLHALGYIGEDTPWQPLDPDWRDGQIARLRDEYRKDYIPLTRGGVVPAALPEAAE
jgi:capsular polysaccharide biosynthesis protein